MGPILTYTDPEICASKHEHGAPFPILIRPQGGILGSEVSLPAQQCCELMPFGMFIRHLFRSFWFLPSERTVMDGIFMRFEARQRHVIVAHVVSVRRTCHLHHVIEVDGFWKSAECWQHDLMVLKVWSEKTRKT